MKHVNNYENYLVERFETLETPLMEKEVFVTDERFKDEKSLLANIATNMGPAINKLLKDNGISYNPITVSENRGRYSFDSKPLTGAALGIMQYGFYEVYIDTFGGGSVPKVNNSEAGLEFPPYIWFNLHYSYNHGSKDTGSQGSNGCSLYLPGERRSDIFYDIVNAKFLKVSEAEKLKIWG